MDEQDHMMRLMRSTAWPVLKAIMKRKMAAALKRLRSGPSKHEETQFQLGFMAGLAAYVDLEREFLPVKEQEEDKTDEEVVGTVYEYQPHNLYRKS